jgi:hypothetical protein
MILIPAKIKCDFHLCKNETVGDLELDVDRSSGVVELQLDWRSEAHALGWHVRVSEECWADGTNDFKVRVICPNCKLK